MTWTATEGSHVFRAFVADTLLANSSTGYTGLDSDSCKVALYGNTGTPDRNVAANLTGYNAATSQWVLANEISAAGWAAGGLVLAGPTINQGTANTFYFDGTDRASSATTTLTNVYGCLNYDDTVTGGTVAKVGISFHFFGGAQSVTAGTFTVIWAAPTAAIFSGTV
jgi:hypothetical protein